MDKLKLDFPDLNFQYSVPYANFMSYCVTNFCSAKFTQNRSLSKEVSAGVNPFAQKFEEYHNKTIPRNDIKVYDKVVKSARRKLKECVPMFADLILSTCEHSDREEFEDFKVMIQELLQKKCESLLDAIVENNREMWFTLLTIEKPGDSDLDYFSNTQNLWAEIVRFEVKNSDVLEGTQMTKDFDETEEGVVELRVEQLTNFCKSLITCPKMTQEICRLIIYMTAKDI